MLHIDGSQGEGGGQVLRSSLALSMCLARPFRISSIRAARRKPGLQPQHLVAIHAAAAISRAEVEGAEAGSPWLIFRPQQVVPGEYRFSIGTAGSTTLVLQTVLPALMLAESASSLVLEGGTHNPLAPPFDFLAQAFLPLINAMGPTVTATLERPGFFPRGGGRILVDIKPAQNLKSLKLPDRGRILEQRAEAMVSNLPEHIAQRELKVVGDALGLPAERLLLRTGIPAWGPGNVVSVFVRSEHVTEVFTGFGERGVRAETVAERVVRRVRRYLAAGVPVGRYLADQLLLPMALCGDGEFLTLEPSLHTLTNMAVVNAFMGVEFLSEEIRADAWRIAVQ